MIRVLKRHKQILAVDDAQNIKEINILMGAIVIRLIKVGQVPKWDLLGMPSQYYIENNKVYFFPTPSENFKVEIN